MGRNKTVERRFRTRCGVRTSRCSSALPLGAVLASRCHLLTCLVEVVLQASTTLFTFCWIVPPQGIVTTPGGTSYPFVALCLAEVVAKSGSQTHLLEELQSSRESADGSDTAPKQTHTAFPRSVPDTEFLFEGGTPATHTSSAPNTKKLRRDDRRTTSAFGAGSNAVQNVASNKEETRKSATASRVDVDLGYDGSDTAHFAAKPENEAAAPVEASFKMLRRTGGQHEEAAAAAHRHEQKIVNQEGARGGQENAIEMSPAARREPKASAPDDVSAAAAHGANKNNTQKRDNMDTISLAPPSNAVLTLTPPAAALSSITTTTSTMRVSTMLRRQQREDSSTPEGAAVEAEQHDAAPEAGARAPSAPAVALQRMTTQQERAEEYRSEQVEPPSSSPGVEAVLFLESESVDINAVQQGEGEEREKTMPGPEEHERTIANRTTSTAATKNSSSSVHDLHMEVELQASTSTLGAEETRPDEPHQLGQDERDDVENPDDTSTATSQVASRTSAGNLVDDADETMLEHDIEESPPHSSESSEEDEEQPLQEIDGEESSDGHGDANVVSEESSGETSNEQQESSTAERDGSSTEVLAPPLRTTNTSDASNPIALYHSRRKNKRRHAQGTKVVTEGTTARTLTSAVAVRQIVGKTRTGSRRLRRGSYWLEGGAAPAGYDKPNSDDGWCMCHPTKIPAVECATNMHCKYVSIGRGRGAAM